MGDLAAILPYRIGRCLYLYLRDIIPFREMIEPSVLKNDGFLFSNGKGGCWTTSIQTAAMVDFTERWAKFRCTSQMYRHIVKAIDREFWRGESVDDGRDDEQMIDEQMAAHDFMQGHSLQTANSKYGLTSALMQGLNPHTNSIYRNVSDICQIWYGLEPRLPRPVITRTSADVKAIATVSLSNQCEKELQKIFGNEAQWRSNA